MTQYDECNVGLLRAEIRDFLDADRAEHGWKPRCDSWLRSFDLGFSRRLADAGWVGATWPSTYGGAERSNVERMVVTEELLFAGAPVAAHWIADRQIGPALLHHGSEAIKHEFLPRIIRCEIVFCVGLSEPDTGSDLAGLRTRAEPVTDGWRITGGKIWVSHAHRADFGYILARTATGGDKHDGLTEFIIDMDAEGVAVRPIIDMEGEHHFNELLLDGVFVPDERVVGTVDEGWPQITSQLAFERSGPERILSSALVLDGLLEQAMRTGGEILAVPAGDLVARTWVLRQMSRQVAREMDTLGTAPAGLAALVKLFGTKLEQEIVEIARSHSPFEPSPGDSEPWPALVAAASYAAPTFTLRGGANEILRGIVAKELVK
ncbi:MAG: acyl-CoA dehydrogenase family protein [Actinomycetota bacterium]|jgi:acyl-CoA dehydrogenase